MDDEAREPYKEKAKRDKEQTKANPTYYGGPKAPKPKPVRDIMTTQGELYSEIQKRRDEQARSERDMKKRISDLINHGFLNNSKQFVDIYCNV